MSEMQCKGMFFVHRYQGIPPDISTSCDDLPTQPICGKYPKGRYNSQNYRFSARWYDRYPWIEYSLLTNKIYCFPCRHFLDLSANTRSTYATTGFDRWHKGHYRLTRHQASQTHLKAVEGWRQRRKKMNRNKTNIEKSLTPSDLVKNDHNNVLPMSDDGTMNWSDRDGSNINGGDDMPLNDEMFTDPSIDALPQSPGFIEELEITDLDVNNGNSSTERNLEESDQNAKSRNFQIQPYIHQDFGETAL